jgi:hypothetical protein
VHGGTADSQRARELMRRGRAIPCGLRIAIPAVPAMRYSPW